MLKPTTPLADVFDQYLRDANGELAPSTFQPYRSHLTMFLRWLQDDLARGPRRRAGRAPTLADFSEANATRMVRALKKEHVYSARGKAIAIRAVGTYLARGLYWFAGDARVPLSIMAQLEIPEMPAKGRPTYSEAEIHTIREAAQSHPTRPYFHAAVQMIDELGLRAGFEAMTLRLADVHLPRGRHDSGHIEIREENSKTPAGARRVPLEPPVVDAIQRYVRMERPQCTGGSGEEETLFLTVFGRGYTYDGWNSMRRRFKGTVRLFDADLGYQASRNRGTRTARLRETGEYEDSEIMEIQGWSTHKMISRYAGRVPLSAFRGRAGTTTLGATRVEPIGGRKRSGRGVRGRLLAAG